MEPISQRRTISRERLAARLFLLAMSLLTLAASARAGALPGPPDPFPDASLENWSQKEFEGRSEYRLGQRDGVRVLEASTDGAASILYKRDAIDLRATPVVHWQWRVDDVYSHGNEKQRDGDDFTARLYVVAKTGPLPWQTLALNYVWAATAQTGSDWPSPYTDKARMIAIRSGATNTGRWLAETRDVRADFNTYFGRDIDTISGYAVMVDGDNTGGRAEAWFGDIRFAGD